VISTPDKWEYPWYAAWDLAFTCVPLAIPDPDFAKEQLMLMVREWYMHPNGQLPAYEWALGDVNPPVHAWAAWRVYKIEKKRRGKGDRAFLQRIFHKLSAPLPTGGHLEQADGTGWMGMYCLNLMAIALELAREDDAYQDVASKFWEHFLYIAHAINRLGDDGAGMWDNQDGFFYDVLHTPDGRHLPLKIRSMVGLILLFAVETLEPHAMERTPGFKRRIEWFIDNRPAERRLLSMVTADQLRRVLRLMLDESEFLSPHGIRVHRDRPYTFGVNGGDYRVAYEPAESGSGVFGGNSNWRGPIWFPVNFLLIESLQKLHHYLGDTFRVECPTGSGRFMTLWEVAAELSRRMTRIFLRDENGARPVHGPNGVYQTDPHWRDLVLFYEYFHGDDGSGVGASHQTGWTGLVAKLLQQSGE
jgi:hypothetical protein